MRESNALALLGGRQQIAAIVFTDAVNSCCHMAFAEREMIGKLERDFRAMAAICAKLRGRVIKTTGDGLLLYFPSAFAAVCFAIRSQQHFAFQAGVSPIGSCLQHRIAIHIGDVLISRSDIMGDGVNVAARVLGETEPGGICLTQMVYDLVRQRLSLPTQCLGVRHLKNIRQPVPIYRIRFASSAQQRCAIAAAIALLAILPGTIKGWLGGHLAGCATAASMGLSVAAIGGYWQMARHLDHSQPADSTPAQIETYTWSQGGIPADPAAIRTSSDGSGTLQSSPRPPTNSSPPRVRPTVHPAGGGVSELLTMDSNPPRSFNEIRVQ